MPGNQPVWFPGTPALRPPRVPRGAVTAGLVLSAPFAFLGLVVLPVGLLLQVGTQSALRVRNDSGRTLWVTPIGTRRDDGRPAVLRQAVSGLLPLPSLRGADRRVEPGGTLTVVFKPGELLPSDLLVRDAAGDHRRSPLRPPELVLGSFDALTPAPPELAALAGSSPQLLPWILVASGALGLAAFAQLLRVRRRWDKGSP